MHISRRIVIVMALLMALVPLGTTTMLSSVSVQDRREAQAELQKALQKARGSYRVKLGASGQKRVLEKSKERLLDLGKQKQAMRMQIAGILKEMHNVGQQTTEVLHEQEQTKRVFALERHRFEEFLKMLSARRLVTDIVSRRVGRRIFDRLIQGTQSDRVAIMLRDEALIEARQQLLDRLAYAGDLAALQAEKLHSAAGDLGLRLDELRAEHEELQEEYLDILEGIEDLSLVGSVSDEERNEERAMFADIHREILNLQSHLARIDAQLKRKAERTLIDKGLRTRRDRSDPAADLRPVFSWPVIGPISAGFRDARYVKIFGIPHSAIDIAVPQGTPVGAAADGIVFLVRDGGAKGYTYVLIGHSDGFATVYGHLSDVFVTAGQEVRRGEVIALSGGHPGTHGAGRMTTGAHLHFETIQYGEHFDPREVLP